MDNMIRTVESDSRAFSRQFAIHMFGHFRMLFALPLMIPTTAGMELASLFGVAVRMLRAKVPIRADTLLEHSIAMVICLALSALLRIWRFPARVIGIGMGAWRFLVYAMFVAGIIAGIFLA